MALSLPAKKQSSFARLERNPRYQQDLIEQHATTEEVMRQKLAALRQGDFRPPVLPCEHAMEAALCCRLGTVQALLEEWRPWFAEPIVWCYPLLDPRDFMSRTG